MWNILRQQRWQWLLVACGLVFVSVAGLLQHYAFPSQGTSSGQISVTVYVRNSTARLILKSFVYPNDPADDYLTINVAGPQGRMDPWLLVIQCPPQGRSIPKNQVQLFTENASSAQGAKPVIARPQPLRAKKMQKIYLGCFAAPPKHTLAIAPEQAIGIGFPCGYPFLLRFGCFAGPTGGTTPGTATGQTINVTLPTLEGDPAAQLPKVTTPVYAEEDARGTIKDLVEVYQAPGVVCPTAVSTATPTASVPTPSPAGTGTSVPTLTPSPAGNRTCYRPKSEKTSPTVYYIPASVQTTETLESTNLSGDRVDSIFPQGQLESGQVTWQGNSGLSPSLTATNLAAESRNSEYTFFAGVLYGLGLSLIFAFIQLCLSSASKSE
jgi:hypothetical protein